MLGLKESESEGFFIVEDVSTVFMCSINTVSVLSMGLIQLKSNKHCRENFIHYAVYINAGVNTID